MAKKALLFCSLFIVLFFSCHAESFSFSISGSGTIGTWDHYSYSIYQYVWYNEDRVVSESHSFYFYGAISNEENAKLKGKEGNWLIYEGIEFDFAIPCIKGEEAYLKKKKSIDSPGSWISISKPVK